MTGRPKFREELPANKARCTLCERVLPKSDFSPEPRKRNGVSSRCKACAAANARRIREAKPGGWRDYYLRTTFGITEARFVELLETQGGGCAICGSATAWADRAQLKNFSVDHDHTCCPGKVSCGKCVRGLLCNTCNRGLGQFRDDPKLLRIAADYLEAKSG